MNENLGIYLSQLYSCNAINHFLGQMWFSCKTNYYTLFSLIDIATVNPKVLVELFSMYRDWQEQKTQMISKKQVCRKKNLSSQAVFSEKGDDFNIIIHKACDKSDLQKILETLIQIQLIYSTWICI